uniref:G-protein coupled receptors family 1 profile domain-containing protein n=1 Tax=Oncorhynchus kisutch TaxID=8019 RepID=A0A8C7LD18_ONCKI
THQIIIYLAIYAFTRPIIMFNNLPLDISVKYHPLSVRPTCLPDKKCNKNKYGTESQNSTTETLLIIAYSCCLPHCDKEADAFCHMFFIINLSVADLMITLLNTPFILARFVKSTWVFGKTICHVSRFMQYCSVHLSVLSLVSFALDRHQVTNLLFVKNTLKTNYYIILIQKYR